MQAVTSTSGGPGAMKGVVRAAILASCLAVGLVPGVATEAHAAEPEALRVAIASSLAPMTKDLAALMAEALPGQAIEFIPGASGTLASQIRNGAPYHVFISADTDYPRALEAEGLTTGKVSVYARGSLVLFSVKARDFSGGLAFLGRRDSGQLALANPEVAPYGRAARQALQKAGVWDSLAGRLVMAPNVGQALTLAMNGTGLGMLNRSALKAEAMKQYDKEGIHWIPIPQSSHEALDQGLVILRRPYGAAALFVETLLGPRGQALFDAWGYDTGGPGAGAGGKGGVGP